MSVKSFKFVSPGVFINEIDNSFIPKSADSIGPVIIGRAQRGLGMQPVKVESYSDFVNMFGDTVPGKQGGDISRYGNYQSPMYGTYAAKAWLNANVGPVTYIRLLGEQNSAASVAGYAGYKTLNTFKTQKGVIRTELQSGSGGTFGLWVFPSYTADNAALGTGYLAGLWYVNASGSLSLSGALGTAAASSDTANRAGLGLVVAADGNGEFTMIASSSLSTAPDGSKQKLIKFGFDDTKQSFLRKRFNTNPQLVNNPGVFFTGSSYEGYWLGESFEQELRDANAVASPGAAVLLPVSLSGTAAAHPGNRNYATREPVAGWFVGQDVDADNSAWKEELSQKLFRLKGRGHGEWLQRNVKVSIENIKVSNSSLTDYGSFSVILRSASDNDSAVQIIERYDNCDLNPASPNYVARLIGDVYQQWDTTNKRLKAYGEYPNQSRFVYVEMNQAVDDGATNAKLLPVGYYGPSKLRDFQTAYTIRQTTDRYNGWQLHGVGIPGTKGETTAGKTPGNTNGSTNLGRNALVSSAQTFLSGAHKSSGRPCFTGSLTFPTTRLRVSASDGTVASPQQAYWGWQNTRTATSTTTDDSCADTLRWWITSSVTDIASAGTRYPGSYPGVQAFSEIFSLLNLTTGSASGQFYYLSGAYNGSAPTSYVRSAAGRSLEDLLNLGYSRFTAPFHGGFDGFDVRKPDPMYNEGMLNSASPTAATNYIYNTVKRAIDSVVDPELVDMNLLAVPGLTQEALTQHMLNVCEERGDAMALVDLPNVYIPTHEKYVASKVARIGTTPTNAAKALRARRLDSSYGATFYPWVQTRDENSGRLVWIPPSVAMMGVLASSQAKSDVWFAPAGFNRGGLSDGAAGIPVTNVSERLVSKDRDTLYESRINPIAAFPSSGIVVFGQKTLQERQSALDRINVRRLVIFLKKQISILSTQVLFEQNVQATWNRFKSLVEPFLANVRVQFGITDYRLILDESTTTPDLIDQNVMYAKIMIKPARAIEYIAIDFVVLNTGASFDD